MGPRTGYREKLSIMTTPPDMTKSGYSRALMFRYQDSGANAEGTPVKHAVRQDGDRLGCLFRLSRVSPDRVASGKKKQERGCDVWIRHSSLTRARRSEPKVRRTLLYGKPVSGAWQDVEHDPWLEVLFR